MGIGAMNEAMLADGMRRDEPDYREEPLASGVRFVLPRRELGSVRLVGWAIAGAGACGALFMVGWMWQPIAGGIKQLLTAPPGQQMFGWISIGFGCLGLIGLTITFGMVMAGLAIARNRSRCTVEIRNGKLLATDHFFFYRLRRTMPVSEIQRLRLTGPHNAAEKFSREREKFSSDDVSRLVGRNDTVLLADRADKRALAIAVAYPHEMLTRLATAIASHTDAQSLFTSTIIERDPLEQRDDSEIFDERVSILDSTLASEPRDESRPASELRPDDTTVVIDRRPDGITIDMPPVGVWKGSKGLMAFSIIWNVFIGLFVAFAVAAAFGAVEAEEKGPPWVIPLALTPFVAVGVGMLLSSINSGRRRAMIATVGDAVLFVQTSIFGKKTREWQRQQLDEIRCGPSGVEINDVPVTELQFIAIDDDKFGCLSHLTDDELRWIAAELNDTLRLSELDRAESFAATLQRDAHGDLLPPVGSAVRLERSGDGVSIHVPPRGIRRSLGSLALGVIFFAVSVAVAVVIARTQFKHGFPPRDMGGVIIASIFIFVFGAVGVAVIVGSIVTARSQSWFTARRTELQVLERSVFKSRRLSWGRDALLAIEVLPTGTRLNNVPIYHLLIRPRQGETFGVMSGRRRVDLNFVAAVLNESLELASSESP
ncbi:MAG: hypothetical protein R3C99_08075 [Pirellulaceae bacterium]